MQSLHHLYPQWQQLQPLQSSLFPPSMAAPCDSNTINLLTCGAAGLLPPPSSPSSIADDILSSMLASAASPPHDQTPHLQGRMQQVKRSFCSSFPEMAASEGGEEEIGMGDENMSQQDEKKSRRLTTEQVKALEKAFEEENKLEPERKVQLALELGLQPRQVAIWFQNRRARWRTKQIEKDYGTLKEKFESMRAHRDALLKEKEKLQAEVARLKGNLNEGAFETEEIKASQTPPEPPPSYYETSSVEESINIIQPSSPDEKKEIDGSSLGESDDGIHVPTSTVESQQPLHNNVFVISKNFTDPDELLVDATTPPRNEDVPKMNIIKEEVGGMPFYGNGNWLLPCFDWWECN